MHFPAAVLMGIGALLMLVFGLAGVLRNLLERGPHEPPLLEDDGLSWPRRYQGHADANHDPTRFSRTWAGDHERGPV